MSDTQQLERPQDIRVVVDTIPALAWSARADGTADFFNQRWLEYTGLTQKQALDWSWNIVLHPDDLSRMLGVFQDAVASARPFKVEGLFRRFDGEYRRFLFRGNPLYDETGKVVKWYGTNTALEDGMRRDQDTDEDGLRTLLNVLPQQIFVLRPDFTVEYVNQAILDYHGEAHRAALFAPDVFERDRTLLHPEDLQRLREDRRPMSRGHSVELEGRMLGRDGGYRWFLIRINPQCDDGGRVLRWYTTGTDIDDLKLREERVQAENRVLREEVDKASMFEEIVGSSPALRTVLTAISQVAATGSTVLFTGETGTGKELIARAIHKRSPRAGRAFVSVNCAALAPSLIFSELFGHEKGAFSGAARRQPGRFELAHGGTIFLDEVGDLPLDTQIALLRVLQEREFQRVGGNEERTAVAS